MKKLFFILSVFVFMTSPAVSFAIPAIDLEAAVGGWMQAPAGELSYGEDIQSEDVIDIDDELNYDTETKMTARAKAKLPVLPGVYLIAAPMEFKGDALDGATFQFGDVQFDPDESIYSKVTLNQYDICGFFGLPILNLATMGKLNIDVGLNVRYMDFSAEISGSDALGAFEEETKSVGLPIPLIYLGAQLEPIEMIALEAELRAITYGDNTLISFIGRLKLKVFGPAFGAAGFRYDSIEIDEEDVMVETSFSGPFLEVGFSI